MQLFYNMPILSLMIFVSFIFAVLSSGKLFSSECLSKSCAVVGSLIVLCMSLLLLYKFRVVELESKNYFLQNAASNVTQAKAQLGAYRFIESYKKSILPFSLGVDGLSLPFIILASFLCFLCVIQSKNALCASLFLFLESCVIGAFASTDLFLLYIFFELSLIPVFFIIAYWGGASRIYSAFKLFLFTVVGSLCMLACIAYLRANLESTDIKYVMDNIGSLSQNAKNMLWLGFFIAFMVKLPAFPFHVWLPNAHVQAPTVGSMILAGVLLKLGGYGMVRVSLPLLQYTDCHFEYLAVASGAIGVVYASILACKQKDIKSIVAYSSVAHMGFVIVGLFSNVNGINGAVFQMISHGLISPALFLCIGLIYERTGVRDIEKYGGLSSVMPKFNAFFIFFVMASVGLPGTAGFIGEILVIINTVKFNPLVTLVMASNAIFGAVYMLRLYKGMFAGENKFDSLDLKDLNRKETYILLAIAIIVLLLGVFPSMLFNISGSYFFYNSSMMGI